ncbi:MAG: zinc-binding alcohol dehydrogenase, partial [Phycisphaeraceae bacterium JB051]
AGRKVKNLKIGDRVLITWSGHASHVVKNADSVFKIEDDSIDLLEACFAHIASFSFLGIRKLKLEIGESVMIAGMGILGAYALQIASLSGAIPVVVADFESSRRELALQLGATAAFSPDEDDFVEKVKNATGGNGPNAVVEVTGSAAALQQALECISYEGRISLLGCTRVSDKPIDFYKYVHRRGISLIGSHALTRPAYESRRDCWTEHDDYQTFMKFTVANKLFTKPIISDVVSPVKANEIYTKISQSKKPPLGIVFDWSKI